MYTILLLYLHFTPIYRNAMQSEITEGEEEVARKPLGFANVS